MKTCILLALLTVGCVSVASEGLINNNPVMQLIQGGKEQLAQRIDRQTFFYTVCHTNGKCTGGLRSQEGREQFSRKEAKELFEKLKQLREKQYQKLLNAALLG